MGKLDPFTADGLRLNPRFTRTNLGRRSAQGLRPSAFRLPPSFVFDRGGEGQYNRPRARSQHKAIVLRLAACQVHFNEGSFRCLSNLFAPPARSSAASG
jgi:hypothetical protein